MKCLFYPNCNRGSNCPFLHEGAPKAKPEPKAPAAKAAVAKAAVATVIASSSIQGADATRTNASMIGKTFQCMLYPFKVLFSYIASLSCLIAPESLDKARPGGCLHPIAAPFLHDHAIPKRSPAWPGGCLHPIAAPFLHDHAIPKRSPALPDGCLHYIAAPSQDMQVPGMPVIMQHQYQAACTIDLEWIADSGASRSLGSVKALAKQGLDETLINNCLEPTSTIKFETGNGVTISNHQFRFNGSSFGTFEHRILDDCPIARSLGEVVQGGKPFIWMPNELPYFVNNAKDIKIKCNGLKIHADRVEDNVPVFKETIQISEPSSNALVSTSNPIALAGRDAEAVVPEDADSEDADEEPINRMQRLIRESQTLEHLVWHFPKNPACPICNRSRMYKKKVQRHRLNPLSERGGLDPTTKFGERIATDFIIVQKHASGKENSVQVIRDEYSGWIRAYPINKRDTQTVVRNILNFSGPSYQQPCILVKSDQAREIRAAVSQLGFVFEGTLENRHPHNGVLERDIRTLEEVTRACHLQAGFDTIQGLWQHSVDFAASIISAKHTAAGHAQTRHKLATGVEFEGRLLLLGQLIHYRVDPTQREKFDASTRPGLFVGWRYGDGPKSHRGVYLVLDYAKVKSRETGYENSISVPAEELYVEDGPARLPVKVAADDALATFREAKLAEIMPLDIPFSSATQGSTRARNEYITLDRIIKFGPTTGCKACAFSSEHSVHNPVCRARFNALIRADRVASGSKVPSTPTTIPPTPNTHLHVEGELPSDSPAPEVVEDEASDFMRPEDCLLVPEFRQEILKLPWSVRFLLFWMRNLCN